MADPDRLALLSTGRVEIIGRMPWSSNATFLVDVIGDDGPCRGRRAQAIYKPVRGERPLWDFEPGLHRRERAAFLLSEAMGIGLVPETVLGDGPLGEGSLQWFVDADHEQHYFTLHETHPELHAAMRAVAAFDLIANNTDRKSGHVLVDHDGHVWAIDHGLCFSADFKLRTVIWEFGGEPIAEPLVTAAARLADDVPSDIADLLADDEVEALAGRAAWVAEHAEFPTDPTGRRYPWPLV